MKADKDAAGPDKKQNAAAAAADVVSPSGPKTGNIVRFIKENYAVGGIFTVEHVHDQVQKKMQMKVSLATVSNTARGLRRSDELRIFDPAQYQLVEDQADALRKEIEAVQPPRPLHLDIMLFICERYARDARPFSEYDVMGEHQNRIYEYPDVDNALKSLSKRTPEVIKNVRTAAKQIYYVRTE